MSATHAHSLETWNLYRADVFLHVVRSEVLISRHPPPWISKKQPNAVSFEGIVAENWKKWLQALKIYLTASGIGMKTDEVKVATLLHVGGEQLIAVYNAFSWNESGDQAGDDQKFDKVVAKFAKYCEPRKNITYLRYQVFTRAQGASESVDQFMTELHNKAKQCEFGGLQDSLIRDRLICCLMSSGDFYGRVI